MTLIQILTLWMSMSIDTFNTYAYAFSISRTEPRHDISRVFTPRDPAISISPIDNGTTNPNDIHSSLYMTSSTSKSNIDHITSSLIHRPNSIIELTLVTPPTLTKAAYRQVLKEESKALSIPGFRKGSNNIPISFIVEAMKDRGGTKLLHAKSIERIMYRYLEDTLKKKYQVIAIGDPMVMDSEQVIDVFKPGEALEMVVQCDVWPEFHWKNDTHTETPYKGITGSYRRMQFNETKYDLAVRDLCERYAIKLEKHKGDGVEMGDVCKVQAEGYYNNINMSEVMGGKVFEVICEKGKYMEGLVEGLIGAKVGETRNVTVVFPNTIREKKLKKLEGKEVRLEMVVEELFERSVPELDEDMVGKIRKGLTVEHVSNEIRKAVDMQDTQSNQWMEARNKVLADALCNMTYIEVPDTLITHQARERYAQKMMEYQFQGMSKSDMMKQMTAEDFTNYTTTIHKDIVQNIKTNMAIEEIARIEQINVPDTQIDEQVEVLWKKRTSGTKDTMDKPMLRDKIKSLLQQRMVFEYLDNVNSLVVEYVGEDEDIQEEPRDQMTQEGLKREIMGMDIASAASSIGVK